MKYRIYVRGMGCSTSEDGDFHVVDGVQFNGKMKIGRVTTGSDPLWQESNDARSLVAQPQD